MPQNGEIGDYIREDEETLQKSKLYLLSLDAIDHLESLGIIEITNDYKNKTVLVRETTDDNYR